MAERTNAQKRWKLLARAVSHLFKPHERELLDENNGISIQSFTSFKLLQLESICLKSESTSRSWWLYSCFVCNKHCEILVSHVTKLFAPSELVGFNNTGNICVWPSEECLAYYLLKRPEICRGRKVLELGGGMSCLAGVLAAKYCGPSSVMLTDGNGTSVDNIRCIIERNGMTDLVKCCIIRWSKTPKTLLWNNNFSNKNCLNQEESYEVIICADCLFFDDVRLDLVDTIYGYLTDDGVALVMAPYRGETFHHFIKAAIQRGFVAHQIKRYDSEIWSRHIKLLKTNRDYCPDLHFPLLLKMSKQKN
ncbi:calmodulin-lysine N-methyltransferase [Copidosoma floridanum]|uniref:calmodulin-lysine N-methyltransferase n=1 Tax=Copidosoma floridanum TaxID=29053 RepID=UPI0006C93EFE|nr:calmodulin-lysine N-methyltransferase [Copidosoma floridanum]